MEIKMDKVREIIEGYYRANFDWNEDEIRAALNNNDRYFSLATTEVEVERNDFVDVEVVAIPEECCICFWEGGDSCRYIEFENVDKLLTFISNTTFEGFVEMVDATDEEFESTWGGKAESTFGGWRVHIDYESVIGTVKYVWRTVEINAFFNGGKDCLIVHSYEDCNKKRTALIQVPFCHFNNDDDFKRELGLTQENPENMLDRGIDAIFRLNKDHPLTPMVAKWLVQAKWSKKMTIELVSFNDEVDE